MLPINAAHIAPIGRKKQGAEGVEETKNQVVMNICMEDWQKLKDSLDIDSAMIGKVKQQSGVQAGHKKARV